MARGRAPGSSVLIAIVLVALVLVALVLLASCSGGGSKGDSARSTTSTPIRAPSGDLYQPPAGMRSASPGTLIWARLFAQRVEDPALIPAATIWQILYHSRDRTGRDIAVSGFAVVPNRAAPAGRRPVYAWAHALAGLGDRCAPSKAIPDNLPPYARPQIGRGAVVVATDYEGLGTPGEHPYLDGVAGGRNVLDSVRAAAALPNVGTIGDVVLAGASQGGGAALWAAQIANEYAPELHLRGVIALAPTAELPTLIAAFAAKSSSLGEVLLATDGLRASYPDLDPGSFLTPTAVADLERVGNECAATTIARYRSREPRTVVSRNPDSVPTVHTILNENSPGATDPDVPILLVQGGRDEQTRVRVTARLRAKYCARDATVTRIVYPRANHAGVITAAQTDAFRWIADRYARQPTGSGCKQPPA